jgi:VWFA-related protein
MLVLSRHRLLQTLLMIGALSAFLLQSVAQDIPDKDRQEKQGKRDEAGVIRMDTDLVTVDVIVTDRNGNRSPSVLKASDFTVYEDGVRQEISAFSATDVPFNLVLLLDTSGSTRDEVGLMRRAARRFLDELRPEDRVAVVQFNKQVELLEDLTSDRAKIEDALQLLNAGSGTSFYDSLKLTVDEVFNRVDGRKAIIALTDGVDSYGYLTYGQILPSLERGNILAYFLELDTEEFTQSGMTRDCGDDNHFEFSRKQLKKYLAEYGKGAVETEFQSHCLLSRMERMQINRRLYESARRELREMSNKTGGRVYPVKDLQQLEPAYSQIAAELRTHYSIAYYPKKEKHDGKWRTLRVTVDQPGLITRARTGYRAPLN